MEEEGEGAVSVSQSVARQGCGLWTAPSLATPMCAPPKFQGDETLLSFPLCELQQASYCTDIYIHSLPRLPGNTVW